MHTEAIRVPPGHCLIKHDETVDGETIALTKISAMLFAIFKVTPGGRVYDEKFAASQNGANTMFERRLMGRC